MRSLSRQRSQAYSEWSARLTTARLIGFGLLLAGLCLYCQSVGNRSGWSSLFQKQQISTDQLTSERLEWILRQSGHIERVPTLAAPAEQGTHTSAAQKFNFRPTNGLNPAGRLVVTEVQPSNAGEVTTAENKCPDWIELWNPSENPFDATGWFLTDDPSNLGKWKFPELIVQPGERFLVYASGQDRQDVKVLHTNFRLGPGDRFVALVEPDRRTIHQQINIGQHQEHPGISYAASATEPIPLVEPTPNLPNARTASGFVDRVRCDVDSQLFSDSLTANLTCDTASATIRFTTDGSLPSGDNGQVYRGPIQIDHTTVLTAIAEAPGKIPSRILHRSFLSIPDTLNQPKLPNGVPSSWGETPADYEMDPRVVLPHQAKIRKALQSLPVVSVVAPVDKLFGPQGIYTHTWERGFDWEIPATIEMLAYRGRPGFCAPCGIRIAGNESRSSSWKKHSLRINFRGRYGQPALSTPIYSQPGHNRFSTLVLRSTDDSWLSHDPTIRASAQYIRDQWARETELAMGRTSPRGRFVHAYLNGMYWGIYCLVERPDNEFLANQLGGDADDYLTLRTRVRCLEGDPASQRAWEQIARLADRDMRNFFNVKALANQLDLEDLIDYCLILIFAGGEDWALINENNMRAYRNKRDGERMKFIIWDADSTFASGWNNDSTEFALYINRDPDERLFAHVFRSLGNSPRFRRLFIDRLQKWTAAGQPLDPERARRRYRELTDQIEPALWAESARWGDVHRHQPYLPDQEWNRQKEWILADWFGGRAELMQDQLMQHWRE